MTDERQTTPTTPTTPRTEAGRALLARGTDDISMYEHEWRATILAIEAEVLEGVAERVQAARHAVVQASIDLANGDTVAAHGDIERAHAALLSADRETLPKRKRIDWSDVVVDEGDEAP